MPTSLHAEPRPSKKTDGRRYTVRVMGSLCSMARLSPKLTFYNMFTAYFESEVSFSYLFFSDSSRKFLALFSYSNRRMRSRRRKWRKKRDEKRKRRIVRRGGGGEEKQAKKEEVVIKEEKKTFVEGNEERELEWEAGRDRS